MKHQMCQRKWRVATAMFVAAGLWIGVTARAQQDATVKLLAELTDADGAPGFEGPVRTIVMREWKSLLDNLHIDGLGNVLGTHAGQGEGPRVLLMAHMDEVGFLVRYIDDNGYVYISPMGGYIDQSVLTQRFTIATPNGPVVGYTGMKSTHIVPLEERNQMVALADMFLDIGARSRDEATNKFGVRPGQGVTYRTKFEVLNEGSGRYIAKAWDDRVGLAVITDVLKQLRTHPNALHVAATVQEEIGLRGASVVQNSANADIVINLEIGIANDFPLRTAQHLSQEALGKGATVFVFDGSMIPNQKYVDWIVKLAKDNSIPIQFTGVTGYGEDAAQVQKSGTGVPAVNLGVPTRYGHSQSGVIDRADYDATVKLVRTMIEKLSAAEVKAIREF
jgi:putative aminopeptidase FrvX